MATSSEATQKATEEKTMATQRAPQLHQVYVVYLKNKKYADGQEYEKDQDLEVYGYPPKDLHEDDVVVFIPFPPGELKLTFKNGSNFTDPNTSLCEIVGQEPKTVIREMTDTEFDTLTDQAKKEKWSLERRAEGMKKNAFPFMCTLNLSEKGSNSEYENSQAALTNSKSKPKPHEVGFPTKRP